LRQHNRYPADFKNFSVKIWLREMAALFAAEAKLQPLMTHGKFVLTSQPSSRGLVH